MNKTHPFVLKEEKKQGFLKKIFARNKIKAVILKIHNLLANSSDLKTISIGDVENILQQSKIKKIKSLAGDLGEIYREYLEFCLKDKFLSDDEIANLKHLKNILFLNDVEIKKIHDDEAKIVYKKALNEVLMDGQVSAEEKKFLEKIKTNLTLSESSVEVIYKDTAMERYQKSFQAAIEDRKLTPQEEAELSALAENLGVQITYENETKKLLDKYKLFWLIENGQIPPIEVNVNLQKNEQCYFQTKVEWHENRKVPQRIQYRGPTFRVRIMKGVYWRAGDLKVNRVSADVMVKIDDGKLILTNKRIIFMGLRKNSTIQFSKILDFTPYKNGVDIQKDTGKSPFLCFSENVDVFSAILAKLLEG